LSWTGELCGSGWCHNHSLTQTAKRYTHIFRQVAAFQR